MVEDNIFRIRLQRIYSIIKEIYRRYRAQVIQKTGDFNLSEITAVISNGLVRMANLYVIVCHTVNGVSKLHSDIIKDDFFNDYYNMTLYKFMNVTNTMAHRRWLCQSNPQLSEYITQLIGKGFVSDAMQLEKLKKLGQQKKTVLQKLG